MLYNLLVQPRPVPDAVTPAIVEVVKEPAQEISMIDVALAAFGLTGVIMLAALVAGLIAGALFIWFRKRHAVSIIEARGGQHDLFKT